MAVSEKVISANAMMVFMNVLLGFADVVGLSTPVTRHRRKKFDHVTGS
jgi:hypothetical protein